MRASRVRSGQSEVVPLWDDAESRLVDVLDAALHTVPVPLWDASPPASPGVYLIRYRGRLPYYQIAVESGWPIYAGAAAWLPGRVEFYRQKLGRTTNLSVEEFDMVAIPCRSRGSSLDAEDLAIEAFAPAWNQSWMAGCGSRAAGAQRRTQRRSPWSVLHPPLYGGTSGPAAVTPGELIERIKAHMGDTIPSIAAWPSGTTARGPVLRLA